MRARQTDLARHLGLTRARISQLVAAGVIRPGADGLFDLHEAEAAYRANQGEGSVAGRAGAENVAALVALKVELTRARLDQQRAATELSQIRAQVQRGELVKGTAASVATGRILTSLYRRVDSAPLSFLHGLTEDHSRIVEADRIYRDVVRRAFRGAIGDGFIAQRNADLHHRAESVARTLGALADLSPPPGEDPAPLRECQAFVAEVADIFREISADGFIDGLTCEVPPRIRPEGAA